MPEEALKKKAGVIDSWWKIASVIGGVLFIVYEGATRWNNKVEEHVFEKEIENINNRATKRYDRAMELALELGGKIEKLETELEGHLIKDAYERGKTDASIEFLKKKY